MPSTEHGSSTAWRRERSVVVTRPSEVAADRFEFCGRRFLVERDGRRPGVGAELLVDVAREEGYGPVLEMGTGSGCVLLSLIAPRYAASGVGVDESEPALRLARRNYDDLGVRYNADGDLRQVWFRPGAFYDGVPMVGGADSWAADVADDERVSGYGATGGSVSPMRFDLIVAVLRQSSGAQLDALRIIAEGAEEHLGRNRRVIVEVDPTQSDAACEVFVRSGLTGVEVRCDADGNDRVVIARRGA